MLYAKGAETAKTFEENGKRKRDCELRALTGLAAVAEAREEDWTKAQEHLESLIKLKDTAAAHERLAHVLFNADKSEKKEEGARKAYEEFKATAAAATAAAAGDSFSPDIALAPSFLKRTRITPTPKSFSSGRWSNFQRTRRLK